MGKTVQRWFKFAAVVWCISGLFAHGLTAQATTVGPRIEFAESDFDFGHVNQGDVLHHEFVFTNTGDQTLEITSVRPGCGCTTTSDWSRTAQPGESGRIAVDFNSAGFSGIVTKAIAVTSNSRGPRNLSLLVRANVSKPFEIRPGIASFTIIRGSSVGETRSLKIISNREEGVSLFDAESNSDRFRAELKVLVPGREFELQVSAIPPFNSKSTSTVVTIKSTIPVLPVLKINAIASLVDAVAVFPSQITVPSESLEQTVTRRLTIRSYESAPLEITGVDQVPSGASVDVTPIEPGRIYRVSVAFRAGFKIDRNQQFLLAFRTNHPVHSVIEVPVHVEETAPATPNEGLANRAYGEDPTASEEAPAP